MCGGASLLPWRDASESTPTPFSRDSNSFLGEQGFFWFHFVVLNCRSLFVAEDTMENKQHIIKVQRVHPELWAAGSYPWRVTCAWWRPGGPIEATGHAGGQVGDRTEPGSMQAGRGWGSQRQHSLLVSEHLTRGGAGALPIFALISVHPEVAMASLGTDAPSRLPHPLPLQTESHIWGCTEFSDEFLYLKKNLNSNVPGPF